MNNSLTPPDKAINKNKLKIMIIFIFITIFLFTMFVIVKNNINNHEITKGEILKFNDSESKISFSYPRSWKLEQFKCERFPSDLNQECIYLTKSYFTFRIDILHGLSEEITSCDMIISDNRMTSSKVVSNDTTTYLRQSYFEQVENLGFINIIKIEDTSLNPLVGCFPIESSSKLYAISYQSPIGITPTSDEILEMDEILKSIEFK